MQEKETDKRERCFVFFCITLSPSSPGEPGGPEGPGSPCNNKRQGFWTVAHIKTNTPFIHTTKTTHSVSFFTRKSGQTIKPSVSLRSKERKVAHLFRTDGLQKHTLKKKKKTALWNMAQCYECGRRGTLGPDCPGMPLAPSDPGRPCKNNNSYVTRLLTDHCKHAMKARIRPAF